MPETSVLIQVLTSNLERHGWIVPDLAMKLVGMGRDPRFVTAFGNVHDYRPFEYARNKALADARNFDVEWCVQIDNDIIPQTSPLDIIASAPSDAAVIGCRYAISNGHKVAPTFFPEPKPNEQQPYEQVDAVAGGVLCIRNTVWKALPKGPWFQWKAKEGSELCEPEYGEDVFFCNLVRAAGMKVYLHHQLASHIHGQDITAVACAMHRPH
jgi:hypothetical protein